jgi:hypothetical protein
MIYQVRVNFYLANEGFARGLYNHCLGVFPLATSIRPNEINAEFSVVELIENHHDESPTSSCFLLEGITTGPEQP